MGASVSAASESNCAANAAAAARAASSKSASLRFLVSKPPPAYGAAMAKAAPRKPASAAVTAVVGNEPYLQRVALEQLIAAAPPDAQRLDFDGSAADAGDVFDEARSVAMFGGARLVVVRDADEFFTKHRAAVETFLESLESGGLGDNRVVFRCNTLAKNTRVYKLIDKIGRVVTCEPPKDRELPAWIAERGKTAYGIAVSRDAAALLAEPDRRRPGDARQRAGEAVAPGGGRREGHARSHQRRRGVPPRAGDVADDRPPDRRRRRRGAGRLAAAPGDGRLGPVPRRRPGSGRGWRRPWARCG